MRTKNLRICAVVVSAAIAAMHAQGQSLSATFDGIEPALTYQGTWDGENIFNIQAGVMNFTNVDTGLSFSALCVQPDQDILFGETMVYEIQSPLSLADSDLIGRLIGAYLASSPTDQNAAAVQWAIWAVTTDSPTIESLLDGRVRITDPAGAPTATLANQYLANALNYSPVSFTYLTNPNHQDVVTWSVVPEPASAGLVALSGLLLLRRRRA